MENNIILFDIDYTLFNVGKYREAVFKKLEEFFPNASDFSATATQAYEEIRKEGWFDIKKFTTQLLTHIQTPVDRKILEDVWRDASLLEEAIYPEAFEVLETLSHEDFMLGIFSSGMVPFQKSKIKKIAHFFADEHIHIHELKNKNFPDIVKKYHSKKIVLVDDYIPVIENAKIVDTGIITVWIKRGKLSETVAPSLENVPDFTIENLRELPAILAQI